MRHTKKNTSVAAPALDEDLTLTVGMCSMNKMLISYGRSKPKPKPPSAFGPPLVHPCWPQVCNMSHKLNV